MDVVDRQPLGGDTRSVDQRALACNGQAGVPKPGAARNVVIAGAALDGLIGLIADPLAALAVAPLLAGKVYDLTQLCSKPQPPDPNISAQDVADALRTDDLVASGNALLRLHQWLDFALWPNMCDCTNGTSPPAVTTAPLPPAGQSPGMPNGAVGVTCWDANATIGPNTADGAVFNTLFPQLGNVPGWNPVNGP